MKKRICITIGIIFSIILIILFPWFMDKCIFSNDYISKVSNDGWAGFYGGYVGGIIGGIVTLIAMVVPLRQTQKQILSAEEKNELIEKKKFTDEISSLVIQYINDLQIYHDKQELLKDKMKIVDEPYIYYNTLKHMWSSCSKGREILNTNSYFDLLYKKDVKAEYPKRFFRQCEANSKEELYDKYEEDLENKITSIDEERQKIKQKYNECKQHYVIGNNQYLLLELYLGDVNIARDLWNAIEALHKHELNRDIIWKYQTNKQDFIKNIEKIKKELRDFITRYTKK